MKIVTAKNNAIAAGRDVNITVSISGGRIDLEKFLQDLEQKTGLKTEQLLQVLQVDDLSTVSAETLQKSLQKLLFGQSLSQDFESGKFLDFANTLDNIVSSASDLSSLSKELHRCLGVNDFNGAYQIIDAMLASPILPEEYRKPLAYEYFQTGYIHFANSGDRDSISSLYERATTDFSDVLEPELLCLLAEMQQEVATREIEDAMLIEHKASLEELTELCSRSPEAQEHHQILMGLCLRRLGERGDVASLDKSIALQRELRTTKTSRPIELTTNFANALIRRFEALGDLKNLDEAREVLETLDEPENTVILSEFQAYPKSQNALGNVFKQKVRQAGDAECYAKALEAYTKAEKYWPEKSAPYEWAMLQKNKAETALFFAKNSKVSMELIETAITQAEVSLRYRTKTQAPYQFDRSTKILQALQAIKLERQSTI